MKRFLSEYGLLLAWLIALAAVIITLYLSEFLSWPVCHLCWYQRIAIYPLAVLLGVAAYRDERCIIPYAQILCVIGFLFALYQYLEQMIPGFEPIQLCTRDISCATTQIKWFGFVTVPLLSAMVCVIIYLVLMRCGDEQERCTQRE